MNNYKGNNCFDLIRLFAALQVVIGHASFHLKTEVGLVGELLKNFPGVPIFFVISGYCVTKSLLTTGDERS